MNSSVNPKLIEEFRYRTDASVLGRSPLVANVSLYKDPAALSRLGYPLENFTQAEPLSQFVFVTASDDSYFHITMDAVARTQLYFPNHSIYFYDLSDGVLDNKVDQVSVILCRMSMTIKYLYSAKSRRTNLRRWHEGD